MKSMNELNNNNNNNNNGSNSNINSSWLGFSLSPHMKMEATSNPHHPHPHNHQFNHHQSQTSPVSTANLPTNFYINTSEICYGGVGQNSGFHSPLTVMPLKSDGSLCIIEALRRSQQEGMVQNSSPKLEDFLGGATMGAAHHQYGTHEREAMPLTLDSVYSYQQHHHNPDQDIEVQHNPYYSALYQTHLEGEVNKGTHLQNCDNTQIPTWVSGHYSDHRGPVEDGGGGGSGSGGGGGGGGVGCGDLKSLSLSMSPGSQSSCVTASRQISPPTVGNECVVVVGGMETKKRGCEMVVAQKQKPVHRKSIDTFGQRTSQYRGVTRHRWTGRYEAHLWDNSCKKEGQTRKGRQVYLGGYDMEEKAARSYDLAALKYWGPATHINFPLENYQQELEVMTNMTRQEFVASLRRKSSGFSRGASMYRGVTRHHQHGRWQARIGRVAGNKDLYLGTFSTQEEAAEAYDIAAIKFRGVNAVTNFDISRYDVERIMASNTLLAGELAKRNKDKEEPKTQNIAEGMNGNIGSDNWKMLACQSAYQQQQEQNARVDEKEKLLCIGNYGNTTSFTMALRDLIGMGIGIDHHSVDNNIPSSNSLVTSLSSSSTEASPPHPPINSMAQFPVFAAWNE